jgi:hypothetical protein
MPRQSPEGVSDPMRWNAGLSELAGSTEEDEILEGKAITVARATLRGEEPRPGLGTHLILGEAQ